MTKFKSFWAAKKIFCFLCKHRFAPKHSSLRYLKLQMWWVDKFFTEFACWWNQSKGGGEGGSVMIFYIAPFFTISPMSAWPIHLGENKGRCIYKSQIYNMLCRILSSVIWRLIILSQYYSLTNYRLAFDFCWSENPRDFRKGQQVSRISDIPL